MNEESPQPEVTILGPGQILRQAREKAQLTTQDIADKIRLKRTLIEDIEQDNYDIKLSLTFVKGYLKLYAKHVDVSESEVLAAFDKLNTQEKEPAKLQSFSRRLANQANDDKLMLVTYLIVAVVIALVVIWWLQQGSTETRQVSELETYSSESEAAIDTEPRPEDLISETSADMSKVNQADNGKDSNELETALNTSLSTSDSVVSSEIEQDEQESSGAPQQGEQTETSNTQALDGSPTQATAEPVELVFEFAGDCWMNLSDATGENIAYGVKVKGRVMPISGIPPFVVTLGAPEVVQIRYAGEQLDMSFLTPGRIAKFELPLSE